MRPHGTRRTRRLFTAAMAASLLALLAASCGEAPARQAAPAPEEDPRRQAVRRFWSLYDEATKQRIAGDHEGAGRLYEEALSINPAHEESLYYLGQCRRELGRFTTAREAYQRLVEVNPASARGHLALGALLASPDESAPFDLEVAESHLRRALEINQEETGPLVRLGEIQLARGNLSEARALFEDALRSNHRSVEAAFLAGFVAWSAGDGPAAIDFYRAAIDAARPEVAIAGVLGEGDRRVEADGQKPARAPPLRSPMGSTLYGSFSSFLREAPPDSSDAVAPSDLEAAYAPVRAFNRSLARRLATG